MTLLALSAPARHLVREPVACMRPSRWLAAPLVLLIGAGVGRGSANVPAWLFEAVGQWVWVATGMRRSWLPAVRSPSLVGRTHSGVVTMGGRGQKQPRDHIHAWRLLHVCCNFVSPEDVARVEPALAGRGEAGSLGGRDRRDPAAAMRSKQWAVRPCRRAASVNHTELARRCTRARNCHTEQASTTLGACDGDRVTQ